MLEERTTLTSLFAACLLFIPILPAQTVTGTATYRERIALPPDAVFEATLEEVSRADTPGDVIGRTRLEQPGQPPIQFSIQFDPARIVAARSYSVRARVTVGGNLMFVSDQSYPVLTQGNGNTVAILMRHASGPASPPASLGARDGMFQYFADAPVFLDCQTRQRWPVAMEGEYRALEIAYLDMRRQPGEELKVTIEGQVSTRPNADGRSASILTVDRFLGIWPGETCGVQYATSPLQETYWKLTRLEGKPVIVRENQREPHLVFRAQQNRVTGFGGCNSLSGAYNLSGSEITFSGIAATQMACIQGMDIEAAFFAALGRVRSWKIIGEHLELYDARGSPLALFEARALR